MSNSPLFREEALQYQSERLYGSIILTRHWSYATLTLLFSAIVVALIIFFWVAGYTRKETVAGVIAPSAGLVRIASPQASVVRQLAVRVGQEVNVGDVLCVLESERESQHGETQGAVSAALRSRIEKLRNEIVSQQQQATNSAQDVRQRIAELKTEIDQLSRQIALVEKKLALAKDEADRFAELVKKQYASRAQADEKLSRALEVDAQLHELLRTKSTLKRELATQEAQSDDVPLHARRETSELERQIAEAQQDLAESEANRELVIRAAQSGRVMSVFTDVGQTVAAQQPIATILPANSTLEAELYVPTRAIGFVRAGNQVMLRYAAFPYEKFGQQHGVVREVSRATLASSDLKQPASIVGDEPVYRVRVKLDRTYVNAFGAQEPLQPGMQLEASIVLEYRKLYEWVLGPALALKQRID